MKITSIKFRLYAVIVFMVLIVSFVILNYYFNGVSHSINLKYHGISDCDRKFSDIIFKEQTALKDPSQFNGLSGEYAILKKMCAKYHSGSDRFLIERETVFNKLFEISKKTKKIYSDVHTTLLKLTADVKYIHEHHIAYLQNLFQRKASKQDYDIGGAFERSPVKSATEPEIIKVAVSIQSSLASVNDIFYRIQRDEDLKEVERAFSEKIKRFFLNVNMFESYSLDAQDGILVEELLQSGRQFEKLFRYLLIAEQEKMHLMVQLKRNRARLLEILNIARSSVKSKHDRIAGQSELIQFVTLLFSILLAGWIVFTGKQIIGQTKKGVAETNKIKKDFSYRIEIDNSIPDEFKIWYKALNEMARNISDHIKTLRQYKHIISATNDHMSFLDRDYTYLAVNDAYSIAHKKERSQIIGHTVAEILGIDIFEQILKEKLDRCFAGEEIHYRDWFDFPGLGQRYMDVSYYPHTGSDGIISGVVVSSHDITDRKLAEDMLIEKTMYLDNILRSSTEYAIVTTDLNFRITYYNPLAEKFFGYTEKEVIGKTVQEIHIKEDVSLKRFDKVIEVVRTQGEYCYKVEQETDKGIRYINKRISGIYDAIGELVGFALFSNDVTLKETQEKLLHRRLKFIEFVTKLSTDFINIENTKITAAITDLLKNTAKFAKVERGYVFLFSSDRKRLEISHEWCEKDVVPHQGILDGINVSEFKDFVDTLKRDEIVQLHIDEIQATPENKSMLGILKLLNIKSFINIPMFIDEQLIGYIGFDSTEKQTEWTEDTINSFNLCKVIVTNTIERKRLEGRISASLNEKVVLLREIHHRVKNNMQVIISLLRLHARRTDDENLSKVFEDCRDRVNAMSLIHESLYQSDDLAKIDFKVYIKKLCQNLSQAYGVSGKGISLAVGECDVALDMDQGIAIGMVITELISNAFKHAFPTGKRGNVSINLSELDAENIKLIIKDDGKGMPPEIDIMNSPSLGLRLAVSAVTLELGGSIEIERDKGTQYTICFKHKRK